MHCEQEEDAARDWEIEDWSDVNVEGAEVSFGGGGDGGGPWLGPRGIIVLFLKQVHLQNVGAAERERASVSSGNGEVQAGNDLNTYMPISAEVVKIERKVLCVAVP